MARFNIDAAKAAGYSDDEINQFLTKHPDLKESTVHKVARVAAEELPLAGAAAGTALGATVMHPTAGAALGAGAGEAYKQLAMRALGEKSPATSSEAASDIGKTAAAYGAGEAILGPLASKVASTAKTLMAPSKEAARDAIIATEKAAGIRLGEIPDLPSSTKEVTDFANKVYRITSKGADRLARKVDPETLQTLRKSIGIVLDRGVPDETTKNFLSSSKEVFERALDTAVPGYQEARQGFKNALEKEALLDNLASTAKKVGKVAAGSAAGAAGFYGLRRAITGQ